MRSAFATGGGVFASAKSQYEAASSSDRVRHVADSGPNGAVLELTRVRARSRHAVRNSPYAKHALWVLVSNIVGYGIKPLTTYQDLNTLWDDWAEEIGLYRKMALACGTCFQSGEALARFRERRIEDMETVPLDIQIMEPDHLPFEKNELASNGNRIFAGIEEDLIDRRVAYHLYHHHPNDPLLSHRFDGQTHRVPASEVLHLFMEMRPGERRGVPVFATALNALDTLGVYDYAELERKKGAAMYGGYYRKPLDAQGEVPEAFGAIADGEDVAIQPLEPNSWIELPVGYEVEHSTPPPSDPNGDKFRRAMLASIAASLHMTYEHLTWDFEKLGDRQYRAAMLEFVRIVEMYQWHLMIEMFCKPIWKRFVSRAILEGLWTPPENAQRRDYMRCEWTPPARGYIHPVQDIQAYAEAIRAGITSRKRVAGQLGEDVRRIDLENAADQAHADKLKLRYSTYVAQDADQFGPNFGSSASDALEATVQAEADDEVDRFSEEGTT